MSIKVTSLCEYNPYPLMIPEIYLDFNIRDDYVLVKSTMYIVPKDNMEAKSIVFNGKDLKLLSILINGNTLSENDYSISRNQLILEIDSNEPFHLSISTKTNPYKNTSLEGLFLTESNLITQCEAEGFRRISYHPDRPDVLSKYTVRIEAEIDKYPILLSNGEKVYSEINKLDRSRHEVVWVDPHPKPSYLFAIVAGKFFQEKDFFITRSKNKIALNLYVNEKDKSYTRHALESLKRAMKWDENTYGLEYDLSEYNIVAARHFNMGAMENKSLNIFNSKLILADPIIATDEEFERVEAVIAHEYFHNWTGNRVTCRDWFQLSLKEGLTVFRDQSFTGDLHSSAIKRIEDVSFLRNFQFSEDSGPTSHAVKPEEYVSIDNFYTTTIYEKGAEIIRMLQTIFGKENFINGVKNYIHKFDGMAATTEDFVTSIFQSVQEQHPYKNLSTDQFLKWYSIAGTPYVLVESSWDKINQKFTLNFKQFIRRGEDLLPSSFIIPISYALISSDGKHLNNGLYILDESQSNIIIDNCSTLDNHPSLSLFRDFSAPVKWEYKDSTSQLLTLLKYDNDPFARWESGQKLMRKAILERASGNIDIKLEEDLIICLSSLITSLSNDNKDFLSKLLTLPRISELEDSQEIINPHSLYDSRLRFMGCIADKLSNDFHDLIIQNTSSSFSQWPQGKDSRKLIGLSWMWLVQSGDKEILANILEAVKGQSMTMSVNAIYALLNTDCNERDEALSYFYDRWNSKPLVLDTWFKLEASAQREDSLDRIKSLLDHPLFDKLSPNSFRSVLGGLSSNVKAFHSIDGNGYLFMANQIVLLDKINPITASRLAKVFSRWKSYNQVHKDLIAKALNKLSKADLSDNTMEVVGMLLDK